MPAGVRLAGGEDGAGTEAVHREVLIHCGRSAEALVVFISMEEGNILRAKILKFDRDIRGDRCRWDEIP